MSIMSDLILDIECRLQNDQSTEEISAATGMTIAFIEEVVEYLTTNPNDYYDESMDGDFDSAMASAGYGTDEDYGYFAEE